MICKTSPRDYTSTGRPCIAGTAVWRSAAPLGAVALGVTALTTAALLAGCGPPAGTERGWAMPAAAVATPAPAGSRYPNLARGADGDVVLSWVAPAADGAHALQYTTWTGNGWTSQPVTVSSGAGWFVNWADFAAVTPLENGHWAAHWLQQRPGSVYSYDVRVTVSTDQGRSWSAPVTPHDDGTPTEHGFVSMAVADRGVTAVWLDGRNTGGGDHEAAHGATAGAMTLRTAVLDADGQVSGGEAELDARVCDCCQTDAARSTEGLIVAYRDRDEDEVRDISIVRAAAGEWSKPTRVHRDGWRIAACPVNGPAIAAHDRTVAVAWFTAPDQPRIRLAFSDDAGRSFAPALEVAAGRVAGRIDLLLLDDRRAVVSWLAETEGGAEIRAQLWARDGALGSPLVVTGSSVDRAAGFPRMARTGPVLLFAWTEPGATPAVRTAFARLR